MTVDVVHWNPRLPLLDVPVLRRWHRRTKVNNFGDLTGPIVVEEMLRRSGRSAAGHGRLVAVGSIMHLTRPGDVVWGTGVNGKVGTLGAVPDVDVRAVRGPLTRQRLLEAGMVSVPEIYGDPALLWSRFWSRESYLDAGGPEREVTIVPNFHDWDAVREDPRAISPQAPIDEVVSAIANSRLVVGSSLHGIILAESFGVPARAVLSTVEPIFKYEDYYRGSGHPSWDPAETVAEAVRRGGDTPPVWDPQPLLDAFPWDMFTEPPAEPGG